MRVQYGTAVFGVELGSDKPFQGGYLYYLHQVRFRIDARTLHAGCFILCLICVVELIAVAVALLYVFRAIGLVCFAAFLQYAFVSPSGNGRDCKAIAALKRCAITWYSRSRSQP